MSTNRVYLQCRDMGHSWEWHTDHILMSTTNGDPTRFSRELACERCTTRRIDRFAIESGHIVRLGNGYRYAPDYQVKGGLSRQDARDLVFADVLTTATDHHQSTSTPSEQGGLATRLGRSLNRRLTS